ncbi:MAG: aminopeptidase P family N-terminal domain-containing protein [Anaerolineae bacterium]|nr:aminopeptidase P family N-terminal domain-containing protein [Anaerolineae bacterium]
MLNHDGLKRDVARRIERIQAMMQAKGLDALIITGQAQPGGLGGVRYITHAHLWGGAAYAILGATDPHPWLLVWSSYQAIWSRNETTTLPERVESPDDDIVARTAGLAKEYATGSKRIGMVNMNKLMSIGTYEKMKKALDGYEMVEVTADYDAIRQIKTPFELEAMQQNGAILDAAMDVFAENAAVGARYWDVCAAVEGYIKSFGGFWGRTKSSLDLSPYTVPTDKDRRMQREDIINFEIVYESPWGYWLEMTSVFSFDPLPGHVQAMLDGYLLAVENSSALARAGNTFRMIADANDKTLRDLGFDVVGKHTPDCHSTGLDGSDGPSAAASPDFVLKPNMVLSYHPGTILRDDRGFLISDNFLVTPEGAVRLSPHHASRYYIRLDA